MVPSSYHTQNSIVYSIVHSSLVNILRPSLKNGKRVWCSEQHFLSHRAGPYFVKNVIIAFLIWNPSFWRFNPYGLLHSPVCKSSRRLQSLLGQLKTGCKTSFHYFGFVSKYNIIRSSATWLVILNPRLAPPHVKGDVAQNTRPSSHVREGLGMRLSPFHYSSPSSSLAIRDTHFFTRRIQSWGRELSGYFQSWHIRSPAVLIRERL